MKFAVLISFLLVCLVISGATFYILVTTDMRTSTQSTAPENGFQTPSSFTINTIPIERLTVPTHDMEKYDAKMTSNHHPTVVSQIVHAPRDMWVTGLEVSVHNAPTETLHHASLVRLDKQDNECPSMNGERLVTFARDQMHDPSGQLPAGYGMFLPKDTPLLLSAMFHSAPPPYGPGGTYHDVFGRVTLEVAPPEATDLTPVTFNLLRLSESPCAFTEVGDGYIFDIPANTEKYVFSGTNAANDTARMTVAATSTIVYWGGHIHGWEGGQDLRLFQNDELLHSFTPFQASDDEYQYNTPHEQTNVTLTPGDELSIEAEYDNPADEPILGAMGQVGLWIAHPEADPHD